MKTTKTTKSKKKNSTPLAPSLKDEAKWQETEKAAIEALEARKVLWDGIHESILANMVLN